MPRTKRPVKKTEKILETGERGDALKKLEKLVADQKKNIDERLIMEVRNFEIALKILIGSIKKEEFNKTVLQLKNELHLVEGTNTRRSRQSARAASHDDAAPLSSRSTSRRSRSADATARKTQTNRTATTQRRRSKSVYRTPAYNKNTLNVFPTITPKVAPHTPLTVLRQPRQGEMVVSMTGSPVMVPTFSTMQKDEKANCNILLNDGTMLSLQPKNLRQSQAYIPFSLMDSGVLDQLKTLKDNIAKVVSLGERNMK